MELRDIWRDTKVYADVQRLVEKRIYEWIDKELGKIKVTFTRDLSDYRQGFSDGQDHMLVEVKQKLEVE